MSWCFLMSTVVIGCSSPGKARQQGTVAPEVTTVPAVSEPAAVAGPKAARVEEVVEVMHGKEVRDRYRWMEAGGAEMEASWMIRIGWRGRC